MIIYYICKHSQLCYTFIDGIIWKNFDCMSVVPQDINLIYCFHLIIVIYDYILEKKSVIMLLFFKQK